MGIRKFNVMDLSKASLIKPEQLGYKDSLEIIKDESYKIQKSFVKIGWYLKHIRDNELYSEGGYANIWECAADQLGYSQPTASRFINICEKFSKDHNSPELDDKYAGFDKSQMIEMLPMEQEQLDRVSPDMTVKQIRDIKMENKNQGKKADQEIYDNIPGQTSIETDFPEYMPEEDLKEDMIDVYATSHKEDKGADPDTEEIIDGDYREIEVPDSREENIATSQLDEGQKEERLSPYGLSKTVYPEGSLLTTAGCGHLYNCFSCAQDCAIRQKERYCNEAPMGNPFSCTTMQVLENIRAEIGEQCQFINLDMAKHTAGSHESDPCCKDCNNGSCGYRCRRSVVSKENIQPELPALKNNDQRKEWLANYKSWGLWYRDENIDVNYYKYDFIDGSRLVVAEYPQRHTYYSSEYQDEHYYHLLEKNKKGYKELYDEQYRQQTDSETYLVEFLKDLQKKG